MNPLAAKGATTSPLAVTAGAAAVSWWLAGGIAAGDVAGVWQPKGAASLAASYLRLAGSLGNANIDPAVVGGTAPAFSANGWKGNGANRLNSGIAANAIQAMIVRIIGVNSGNVPVGSGGFPSGFFLAHDAPGGNLYFVNGGYYAAANNPTCVAAIAIKKAFVNGSPVGTISAGSMTSVAEFTLMSRADAYKLTATEFVCAVAFYIAAPSDAQILAVSAAMAAL